MGRNGHEHLEAILGEMAFDLLYVLVFGLAIPDAIVDDHYFYISGYQGHQAEDVSDFAPLTHGQWKNPDFNGAVLPASTDNLTTAIQFFKEAIKAYRS